jgi:predicted transcriptional regulator
MLCRKALFHSSAEQRALAAKLHNTSRQQDTGRVVTKKEAYWFFLKKIQDMQKVYQQHIFY